VKRNNHAVIVLAPLAHIRQVFAMDHLHHVLDAPGCREAIDACCQLLRAMQLCLLSVDRENVEVIEACQCAREILLNIKKFIVRSLRGRSRKLAYALPGTDINCTPDGMSLPKLSNQ
jgi:hypothetical protein